MNLLKGVPVATLDANIFTGAQTFNAGAVIAASQALTGTVANSTISGFLSVAATSGIFGTLTAAAGSITDSSGAISFGNENLTTTGTLAVTGASTLTGNVGIGIASSTTALLVNGSNIASRGQLSINATGTDNPRQSFYTNGTFRLGFTTSATDLQWDVQNNQTYSFLGTGTASFGGALAVTGTTTTTGALIMATTATPTGTGAGVVGQFAWDTAYLYICTATNDWRRIALVDF